jgi:uncharacterized phage-associated protein
LGLMTGVRLDTASKYICEKSGWRLSNLPLQKILYLAQVEYAGKFEGNRLVDTAFEAWDYGPVSPDLYHKVKMFGSEPVRDVFYDALRLREGSQRKQVLDDVCDKYLSVRPGKLIKFTHWDWGAWAKKYEPGLKNTLIADRDIAEEYRNRTTFRREWQQIFADRMVCFCFSSGGKHNNTNCIG